MVAVMTTQGEWLSPAQAAQRLGMTPANVRRLADLGRLDARRTPLGRLVRATDVERLRREREGGR
jgi:hypothetical protein